jgi:uncharacterized membrane protein
MSLYTELRHPGADIGQSQDPDPFSTGYTRFNARVAAWVTARIGSMWTVYICLAVTAIWMVLGSRQVLGFDPYPYPFLLFLGNVVQLLLIFVILLGQQVLGRSADQRAMRTYDYAEAIVVDCEQIQNHLIAQDALLGTRTGLPGTPSGPLGSQAGLLGVRGQRRPDAGYLARADTESMAGAETESMAGADAGSNPVASGRAEALPDAASQRIGFNAALAARITGKVGTMTACYLAVIFQAAWMVTGQVFGFDRYPYLFLLFLSSLIQLILMFVVMVGQQVIGQASEHRAAQTYLNARAVLDACEGLQGHLRAQDLVIRRIVSQLRQRAEQQP